MNHGMRADLSAAGCSRGPAPSLMGGWLVKQAVHGTGRSKKRWIRLVTDGFLIWAETAEDAKLPETEKGRLAVHGQQDAPSVTLLGKGSLRLCVGKDTLTLRSTLKKADGELEIKQWARAISMEIERHRAIREQTVTAAAERQRAAREETEAELRKVMVGAIRQEVEADPSRGQLAVVDRSAERGQGQGRGSAAEQLAGDVFAGAPHGGAERQATDRKSAAERRGSKAEQLAERLFERQLSRTPSSTDIPGRAPQRSRAASATSPTGQRASAANGLWDPMPPAPAGVAMAKRPPSFWSSFMCCA